MTPPTVTTERLTLRGLSLADADAFARFFASDHSAFYGGPIHSEESWRKLSMYAGHWTLRGYGPWAITLTETGETIGMAGPWFPEGWPEPEITYFLLEEFGGKGYATEAVRASLDWVFANGWTCAMSAVAECNAPSIKIVERLGATAEGLVTIPPNREMRIYRYPTPESLDKGAAA